MQISCRFGSMNETTHILHHYIKTSNSRDRRVPTSGVFMRGEPPHKNAACGYPQIYAFTSPYVLVQDVSLLGLSFLVRVGGLLVSVGFKSPPPPTQLSIIIINYLSLPSTRIADLSLPSAHLELSLIEPKPANPAAQQLPNPSHS